eukprot:1158599-Pelagomonas_calceolata.AAC.17
MPRQVPNRARITRAFLTPLPSCSSIINNPEPATRAEPVHQGRHGRLRDTLPLLLPVCTPITASQFLCCLACMPCLCHESNKAMPGLIDVIMPLP